MNIGALSRSDKQDREWTLVIRPQRNWLDFRIGELWQARDLIALFVWRDFVSVYKQTILGPLWYLIQPLMTTLTFTVIFGNIARLPTDGLPSFLFYMSGTVMWSYFAECLNKTANTFISNTHIFGKVYFPRLTVPISILISNLVAFGIQLGLFVAFLLYFWISGSSIAPNLWILVTPFLVVMMAGFGLGFGIIVSSLTTRYRDLRFLVTFGVQLWMYATPVIYPVSSIPEQYRWIILANPLTPVVEGFRYAFLGTGSVEPVQVLYSVGVMVAVLLIGILLFNQVERTFMDTI